MRWCLSSHDIRFPGCFAARRAEESTRFVALLWSPVLGAGVGIDVCGGAGLQRPGGDGDRADGVRVVGMEAAQWPAEGSRVSATVRARGRRGRAAASGAAANWIYVGQTTGRGRMDREHKAHGQVIKDIYLYPLVSDAKQRLCSGPTR